jgi:hypothetical protein
MVDVGMDYKNLKFTSEYIAEAALGRINGVQAVGILGRNPDIDSGQTEELWEYGGVETLMTSAQSLFISSSNNTDNQMVAIIGLDGDYNQQTKLVTLAGQTKTAIEGKWLRVFITINISSTAYAGTLYVYEDDTVVAGVPQTAAKVHDMAIALFQKSSKSSYTIPAGYTGIMLNTGSDVLTADSAVATLYWQIRE